MANEKQARNCPIVTRPDARAAGSMRYFTGIACHAGHLSERIVSNSACLECMRAKRAARLIQDPEGARAYQRGWALRNKDRNAAKAALYYQANKDRFEANAKSLAARKPDARKNAAAIRYKKNKAHILAANREWGAANRLAKLAIHKAWELRNPDKKNANSAKSRAKRNQATPLWADLIAIVAIYAKASSLSRRTGRAHHVDHIVPLRSKRVCGLHCEANLRVLLGTENQRKGNRWWPDDQMTQGERRDGDQDRSG